MLAVGAFVAWPVVPGPAFSVHSTVCITAGLQYTVQYRVQYRVQCSVLCCNRDELVVGSKSCDPVILTKPIKT